MGACNGDFILLQLANNFKKSGVKQCFCQNVLDQCMSACNGDFILLANSF